LSIRKITKAAEFNQSKIGMILIQSKLTGYKLQN